MNPDIITDTFIFIFGLIIGSFFSVVIFRLGKKEGIVAGRSECPKCLAKLKWYDLFPIFSFIALKGRCRKCKMPISLAYLAIELITALSLTLFFTLSGLAMTPALTFWLIAMLGFVLLLFFDALYMVLPDKISIWILGAAIGLILMGQNQTLNVLITAFVFAMLLAIIYLVSRGKWIGFGDIKLVFIIGLLFGYPIGFLIVVASVWVAALWSFALLILKKATMKTAIPFGAFISIVAILFIIFRNETRIFNQFF